MNVGVLYALTAFTIWGLMPIYFKALNPIPPLEILAHRVIWSVVFMGVVLICRKRWRSLLKVLKNKTLLFPLLGSSILISLNWLTFIFGVNSGNIVECSLGYFLNPLLNVLL